MRSVLSRLTRTTTTRLITAARSIRTKATGGRIPGLAGNRTLIGARMPIIDLIMLAVITAEFITGEVAMPFGIIRFIGRLGQASIITALHFIWRIRTIALTTVGCTKSAI